MHVKHRHRAFVTAALIAAPMLAIAAPQVTFQGEITDQTCVAQINGATSGVVLLPSAPASALNAPGATAGLTPFTISVTDCAAPAAALNVSTAFLGHNVTAGGNLGNTATADAATNVAVQLTTDASGGTPITLNGVTAVPGLVVPALGTGATYQYGAQYVAEGGAATPGAVLAVVEYTLVYP